MSLFNTLIPSLTRTPAHRETTTTTEPTVKPRYDAKDFDRAWPVGWTNVKLDDYLD